MNLLNEYFEFSYLKNNSRDKIKKVSIKIKKSKLPEKRTKANGATVSWYIDKFGNTLGNELFKIRRKFTSTNEIVKHLLIQNIPENDKIMLREYIDNQNYNRKISNKKRYSNPEFKKQFNSIMNNPDRISKIKNKSVKMWADAKRNDTDKYKRMLLSKSKKNYIINNYNMNSIEYLIAILLNDMNIKWEYESVFNIDEHTYLPDFYLPDYNSIIECYGDFWHANPNIMEASDTTHKYITAADVWERDKIRNQNLLKVVDNVLCLWETDIHNNIDYCKTKIKNITYEK